MYDDFQKWIHRVNGDVTDILSTGPIPPFHVDSLLIEQYPDAIYVLDAAEYESSPTIEAQLTALEKEVSGNEDVTDYIELVQQQRGSKYPTCRV